MSAAAGREPRRGAPAGNSGGAARTGGSALSAALDSRWFLPLCFLLHVGLRVALWLAVPVTQHSDFAWYHDRAVEIASGQGYVDRGGPTAFWPVGYPGFLAVLYRVFGADPAVGQVANIVLGALVFLLVVRIGAAVLGDARAGRLAALLLAVYPNQIAYAPLLSTEILYQFLLLLAVYLLSRERLALAALAGLLLGAATLTKAQTPALPALMFAAAWLMAPSRDRLLRLLRLGVVVYAAMLCVVAPWTLRNHAVFGAFVPVSTNGGFTLLTGNNPSARGDYTPDDPLVTGLPREAAREVEADRTARARAVAWIGENPGAFVGLMPRKVWRLWAPDGEGEWSYQAGYAGYEAHAGAFRAARVLNQGYYAALMLLAAAFPFLFPWRHGAGFPWAATGWALVGFFTAVSVVFSGQSRFHFALMPWVALYAAWVVLRLVNRRAARLAEVRGEA